MNKTLQIAIDPYLCADQRREYSGQLSYEEMERVHDSVLSSSQPIKVELRFAKERKFIVVTGRIYGDLMLECAACLGDMVFPISIDVRLAIINDDALVDSVPESYDPWLMETDKLMLSTLVEDELLLELPVIARHTRCSVDLPSTSTSKTYTEDDADIKENPFKALEALKRH